MKRGISGLAALALCVALTATEAHGATTKVGSVCKKVGLTQSVGSQKLLCSKVGKNLVWRLQNLTPSPPVPTTPETIAPKSPDRQTCGSYGRVQTFGGKEFVCRQIVNRQMIYFEANPPLLAANNPASPDDYTVCRLPDKRTYPVTAPHTAITYPTRPHWGNAKSGVHKILVVGFDFSDVQGRGSPLDILAKDDLQIAADFFSWYSEGRASLEFETYSNWIRINRPSLDFETLPHFQSAGSLSVWQWQMR